MSDTGWLPVSGNGQGDAAVLELSTPVPGAQGASLARLGRPGDVHGRAVRVFGHP